MKFTEISPFILNYEKCLSPTLCTEIINLFEASDDKWSGKVLDGQGQRSVKQDKISTELDMGFTGEWKKAFEEAHQGITLAIQNYAEQYPALKVYPHEWSGYKIKKYDANEGQFDWHFDALSSKTQKRQVAIIAYLNDVTTGGETSFYYQKKDIQPRAGDILLFPPFWTHMHCGQIPQSGPKYIITSFVEFVVGK